MTDLMDRALSWFVRGWVAIVIAVNVVAIVGLMIGAHGFWPGWQRVADIYSPFNVINWLMEVVLLLPAVGAYAWLQRRRKLEVAQRQLMSVQDVQQIVNAYGGAMAGPTGLVRDVGTLPYPKERIKQALLTAIKLTPAGAAREQLRSGFVMLGDWQDMRASNPTAAMLAEGKALLDELRSLGL